MSMRGVWAMAITVSVLAAVTVSFRSPEKKVRIYNSYYENVLGTSFSLKVAAESEGLADLAESKALAEIDRLAAIFSAYDSTSEFSRWAGSSGRPVAVSGELLEVLSLFDHWKDNTGGALNPAAETISRVWKDAARLQQMPDSLALAKAVRQAGERHWQLDMKEGTALRLDATPLVTNSFVKSYIISKVSEKIAGIPGIHAVLVNIGGDMVVTGDLDEKIRISDPMADAENDKPLALLQVRNRAVATSGNYRRGYHVLGKWYSHIMDPRTGMPADKIISATVVAPVATDAGALATAFNILDTAESRKIAASMPGTEYLLITASGKRVESGGWHLMEVDSHMDKPVTTRQDHLPEQNNFELLVNIELAQFEGRSRRPFVAIWVENSKKETVRNLALWYNKPRWLPELKEWYRRNYSNIVNAGVSPESISSATRPAGKYSIKWDLKDDKGNPVKPGTYTIYIEAAREHGTYDLMKEDVECKKKESAVTLTGGTEIPTASLQYRKANSN